VSRQVSLVLSDIFLRSPKFLILWSFRVKSKFQGSLPSSFVRFMDDPFFERSSIEKWLSLPVRGKRRIHFIRDVIGLKWLSFPTTKKTTE